MRNLILIISTFIFLITSCGPKTSFEDQIKGDLSSKLPTGICDGIPEGSVITNIVVRDIIDMGMQGMTDVSYELDYESNGVKKHHKSALLYIKKGSSYKLASMGGCEYEMK